VRLQFADKAFGLGKSAHRRYSVFGAR
jgi:hypothetical protein